MIVEVRTYKIKKGRRGEFIRLFTTRTAPLQRAYGMQVMGPLKDLEDPDACVWLRGFPSLAERDRIKAAFCDGPEWKDELESIAMSLLESFSVVLTEGSPEAVSWEPAEHMREAARKHRALLDSWPWPLKVRM